MQPENRTQEMAETAERLQVIGSSILRAARDELYLGMRFLGGVEQFFLSDGRLNSWIWNRRKSDVFPAADAWRTV